MRGRDESWKEQSRIVLVGVSSVCVHVHTHTNVLCMSREGWGGGCGCVCVFQEMVENSLSRTS